MHIHTIEEDYEYRMKKIMKEFIEDYELQDLDPEELQESLWSEYAKEFGRVVLEDMQNFSGDELFEVD